MMFNRFKKPAFFKQQEHKSDDGNVLERLKMKTAPSHYPQPLFRALQALQLLCALAVTVIMVWFIYHLRDSSIAVPWKFIFVFPPFCFNLLPNKLTSTQLVTTSLFTLLALTANIVLYLPTAPPPLYNALYNSLLLVLWTAAFGILAVAMKWTLQRTCVLSDWDTDAGMTVCKVYKALFAFALAELPITFLALCLDLVVRRQERVSGVYVRTEDKAGMYDPYSESKRLTDNGAPSPRVLSVGYGLRKDEKRGLREEDEEHMEMEPLAEASPRVLVSAYREPESEETRYDDGGEDIGYRRSGVESVHENLRP
jgi:hypothetical protein